MAIVPLQKVAVLAHASKQEKMLDFLQQEGVMHIEQMSPDRRKLDHSEVRYRRSELEFAIFTLSEVAPSQVRSAMQKKRRAEDIEHAALHTDVRGVIDTVHALVEERKALLERKDFLTLKQAENNGESHDEGGVYVADAPENKSVQQTSKPVLSAAQQAELTREKEVIEKQLAEITRKLAILSSQLPDLLSVRQYMEWLDDKQSAREALSKTNQTVQLTGWIAKDQVEKLRSDLESMAPETALFTLDLAEDEEPPVELRNPIWMRPFESVTGLYGLPRASEIDPTPLLAPFFIVFFGLCLTDAGYGLVLALMMGLYIWLKKITIQEGRLWWLLFFAGIVTFFVSIPFGGWFGMTADQAPSFMTETRADGQLWFKGQVWDLGKNTGILFLQNLSIALGLIHLSLGVFLGGYLKARLGKWAAAFWVDWTTLLLFAAAGAYFIVPEAQQQNALYGIYAAIALVVWGKGYGNRWFLRPIVGLLGLLNLSMSMLSNTLSYLRLLALGLVTGALALAVNLVADQLSAFLPTGLDVAFAVTVYIAGHTANIILNTLGAFIHSGRLQFVEFFGNFFEGGGSPFLPLRRNLTSSTE